MRKYGVDLFLLQPWTSYILWARHNPPRPRTSAEAKGTFLALLCLLASKREEDGVTSPKNVCVGGCHAYRREIMGVAPATISLEYFLVRYFCCFSHCNHICPRNLKQWPCLCPKPNPRQLDPFGIRMRDKINFQSVVMV